MQLSNLVKVNVVLLLSFVGRDGVSASRVSSSSTKLAETIIQVTGVVIVVILLDDENCYFLLDTVIMIIIIWFELFI